MPKCHWCGEQVDFRPNRAVYVDKYWWHYECFQECCKLKMRSKRTSPKWGEYLVRLPGIVIASNSRMESVKAKDEIVSHITEHYFKESKIPNSIYQKLAAYYDGSMRGLSTPIKPEHLLDMWRQKQKKLDKIYQGNVKKGNKMTPAARVSYDLAILASKYHDYLEWLDKQQVQKERLKTGNSTATMYKSTKTEAKKDGIDVNEDLLKDVFG